MIQTKNPPFESGFIEFEKRTVPYTKSDAVDLDEGNCNCSVWVVVFSAKPHGSEVLLHEEKLNKPNTQIAINTIFFMTSSFDVLNVHIFYKLIDTFLRIDNVKLKKFILYITNKLF